MSDLTDQDLVPGRNHAIFLLPSLDKAGRGIVVSRRQNMEFDNWRNMARWMWYIMEAALESESVQRNGATAIAFDDGPIRLSHFDRKLDRWASKVVNGSFLPINCLALHHCFDSKLFEVVIPFWLALMGKEIRLRYRIYPASQIEERLPRFKTMGMPAAILPTLVGGTMEFDVNAWIERRQRTRPWSTSVLSLHLL